jgi:Immunity protein Imm1
MKKNNKSKPRLKLRVGDHEQVVESREWLMDRLDEFSRAPLSDFSLIERADHGSRTEAFIYRLLGLRPDVEGSGVHVLARSIGAAVTFTDDRAGEYRVLSTAPVATDGSEVEFSLANGQRVLHPANEVIPFDDAKRAVLDFYETRSRPKWLSYAHAR